jgi:hypothetical protein
MKAIERAANMAWSDIHNLPVKNAPHWYRAGNVSRWRGSKYTTAFLACYGIEGVGTFLKRMNNNNCPSMSAIVALVRSCELQVRAGKVVKDVTERGALTYRPIEHTDKNEVEEE